VKRDYDNATPEEIILLHGLPRCPRNPRKQALWLRKAGAAAADAMWFVRPHEATDVLFRFALGRGVSRERIRAAVRLFCGLRLDTLVALYEDSLRRRLDLAAARREFELWGNK
jgi:hypothetical protein